MSAAAAIVLLLLPNVSGCTNLLPSTSPTEKAASAYRAKNYQESAALYRSAIDGGDKRPQVLYDYGTALLAGDSLQGAVEVLDRLSEAPDSVLRYRALFNLGLAHLKAGLAAPKEAGNEPLDAALAAYKKVLLMNANDLDAKWNYELALRKKQQGGGGGGGGAGGGQSNASQQQQQPQPSGGLGQQQADQLLGSAAREERDVQAKKQKQTRVEPPPGGKDW